MGRQRKYGNRYDTEKENNNSKLNHELSLCHDRFIENCQSEFDHLTRILCSYMRNDISYTKAEQEIYNMRICIDYAVATGNYAKYRLYAIEEREKWITTNYILLLRRRT